MILYLYRLQRGRLNHVMNPSKEELYNVQWNHLPSGFILAVHALCLDVNSWWHTLCLTSGYQRSSYKTMAVDKIQRSGALSSDISLQQYTQLCEWLVCNLKFCFRSKSEISKSTTLSQPSLLWTSIHSFLIVKTVRGKKVMHRKVLSPKRPSCVHFLPFTASSQSALLTSCCLI